jgi:uncharacterized protein (TIGR00369 family)
MVSFKPKDPQFRSRVEQSFNRQQVMKTLGVKIVSLQPGEIELMMPYVAAYTQHTGFIHAGIIATVLDNACGYAAFSLVPDDTTILTVEFKTNLLAPAKGERFIFRGKVVKPGRTITVCEAQAFAVDGSNEKLVATMPIADLPGSIRVFAVYPTNQSSRHSEPVRQPSEGSVMLYRLCLIRESQLELERRSCQSCSEVRRKLMRSVSSCY